jgi:hypothetical protein
MSEETTAPTGAPPAAPVEATNAPQEQTATPANAEEGQQEPAKPEQPRDEKGKFVQERINELTKARRQAERERDAYAEQLRNYQSQQQQQAPATDKAPALEDFNYDMTAWGAALIQHGAKVAEQNVEKKFSERQQQSSQHQMLSQYEAKEREYAAANPDYAEAAEALSSSVRMHPATLEVIALSDFGPAIVKHLGTHLDVADRISRLPTHLAAAELARIEAQVKAPKPKPVTQAPPPASTVGGGAAVQKDPERMSTDEWLAWRRGQLKAR